MSVQFPDGVCGDGELAPDEVVLLQGAHKVTHGPQLEGALEGTFLLFAADPGRVEAEPGGLAFAEHLQQAVLLQALLNTVAFVEGQVEVVEGLARREGAHRTHGHGAPDQTRPVGGAAGDLGTEVGLPAYGDVGTRVGGPEPVAADGTDDVRSARLTHGHPLLLVCRRAAFLSPFWGLDPGSKRPRFYHSRSLRRYNSLHRPARREASVWSSARVRPRSPWS